MKHSAHDAQMEKLYRKHILKEPEPEGAFVPVDMLLTNGHAKKVEEREEVGSFGD